MFGDVTLRVLGIIPDLSTLLDQLILVPRTYPPTVASQGGIKNINKNVRYADGIVRGEPPQDSAPYPNRLRFGL